MILNWQIEWEQIFTYQVLTSSSGTLVIIVKKKIKVIGSAHNHSEINNKILQGCSGVFISPLYTTGSHTKKNALGFSRFNNLKQYFKSKLEVYALGGIGENNLAKIHSLNVSGFALKSFLEKRQSQKSLGFLNLIARSNVIS